MLRRRYGSGAIVVCAMGMLLPSDTTEMVCDGRQPLPRLGKRFGTQATNSAGSRGIRSASVRSISRTLTVAITITWETRTNQAIVSRRPIGNGEGQPPIGAHIHRQ